MKTLHLRERRVRTHPTQTSPIRKRYIRGGEFTRANVDILQSPGLGIVTCFPASVTTGVIVSRFTASSQTSSRDRLAVPGNKVSGLDLACNADKRGM